MSKKKENFKSELRELFGVEEEKLSKEIDINEVCPTSNRRVFEVSTGCGRNGDHMIDLHLYGINNINIFNEMLEYTESKNERMIHPKFINFTRTDYFNLDVEKTDHIIIHFEEQWELDMWVDFIKMNLYRKIYLKDIIDDILKTIQIIKNK